MSCDFSLTHYRELVRAAGFDVLEDAVVSIDEPEGPVEFQWILARR